MLKIKKRGKKRKKRGKKAALGWTTLVTLVILLLTAAILIFGLKLIPFKEIVDKESCHQSVIQRSATIASFQPGKYIVPLKCKTQEIVIDTTDENEIREEIANAMYDCWWMLGEGKLDFFADSLMKEFAIPFAESSKAQSSCIVCATIKFSDKTKAAVQEVDLFSYIKDEKVPTQDFTYFDYFTDQAGAPLATGLEAPTVKTSEDYSIVFSGIKGQSYWDVLKNDAIAAGVATAGVGFIGSSGPAGSFIVSKVAGASVIGLPLWKVALIGGAIALAGQGYQTAVNNAIVSGRCDGEWKGCYNLMVIPLSASDITKTCDNIESIP